MIRKVIIRNYRKFRKLDVSMLPGVNVLVGSNDSGKSTLIEAINLALTGRVNGRLFAQELSPYYINMGATQEYAQALQSNPKAVPPVVIIEVYLEDGGEAAYFGARDQRFRGNVITCFGRMLIAGFGGT